MQFKGLPSDPWSTWPALTTLEFSIGFAVRPFVAVPMRPDRQPQSRLAEANRPWDRVNGRRR